jgi:hypothetical protein
MEIKLELEWSIKRIQTLEKAMKENQIRKECRVLYLQMYKRI